MFKSIWSIISTVTIILSCYVTNSPIEVYFTSTIGILFVLCVANGVAIGNLLGSVLALSYGYLSYKTGFYGNSVINLFLIFPLQVLAYFLWKRYKGILVLNKKVKWILLVLFIGCVFISVNLSINSGSLMPYHDGISSILLIFATILLTLKVKEQWYAWIPYNTIEVLMWFTAASVQPEMFAVFVMRSVFLINSIIGSVNWCKNSN